MTPQLLATVPEAGFDLVFGGDVVLRGAAAGRLTPQLEALLKRALTVVNLEAPLVVAEAPAPKSGPHLGLPVSAAGELRRLGVDAVGLANNHIGDHGAQGVLSTLTACREAGLGVTGAGASLRQALVPLVLRRGELRIALLAAAEHEFGAAGPANPGFAPVTGRALVEAVAAAREAHDLVVVLAHGGVEELPVSPPQRAAQLRRLLEVGADLVIGAHPHTPQGWEQTGSGVAFHSLGDLLFDRDEPPNDGVCGLLVGVSLDSAGIAGIGVLVLERRGDVVQVAPPRGIRALVEAVGDHGLWQEVAARAFAARYLPLLRRIGEPVNPAPQGPPLWRTVRDLRARLTLGAAPARPPAPWEALQLLNLLRCESHRWTIETATAVAGGVEDDLRTPSARERADAMLAASGFRT